MTLKNINWWPLFPWAYCALCWTLLALAVIKSDVRYLYAIFAIVGIFLTILIGFSGSGKTRFT